MCVSDNLLPDMLTGRSSALDVAILNLSSFRVNGVMCNVETDKFCLGLPANCCITIIWSREIWLQRKEVQMYQDCGARGGDLIYVTI